MSNDASNEPGLRITVVGAGLAGLACAVSLRRQGHTVEIYERSQFANEVGAAISMPRNCTRILSKLGYNPRNVRPTELKTIAMYHHNKDAAPFVSMNVAPVTGDHDFPTYQLHRVDLHTELKRLAIEPSGDGTPCKLHLSTTVKSCDPSKASIRLNDGREVQADVLVIADGIKSELRKVVLGQDSEAVPSGLSCYRFVIPMDSLKSDPELEWLLEDMNTVRIPTDGKHNRIVCYPCRDATLLNVAAIYEDRQNKSTLLDSDATVPVHQVEETFHNFHPRYLRILKYATHIKVWPLLRVDTYDTWVNGRTCLVGDAAHSMLPHVAQGGAQCIEDSASLAAVLPKGTPVSDINHRLKLFESVRKPRCTAFQTIAWRTAEGLPMQKNTDTTQKGYIHMAYDYDAFKIAQEALHNSVAPAQA